MTKARQEYVVEPPGIMVIARRPTFDGFAARYERRILVWNEAGELIGHVGLHCRNGIWDGRQVCIGGVGGVMTRRDSRRPGVATAAMRKAESEMSSETRADFGLLFCEPHNFEFYRRLGWRAFDGEVMVEQPGGRIRFDVIAPFVFDLTASPRTGVIDLMGLFW